MMPISPATTHPATALTLFAAATMATIGLTALAWRYALRRQMLDHPGQRRSHSTPTPRGGGIGPVAAMLIGGVLLVAVDTDERRSLATCLAGLTLVAGVGWLDDHRPLPAWSRLLVHLAAALAVSVALIGMPHAPMQWLVVAISTFAVAGLVNAWNFMDGIDGLATSQAAWVALAVACASVLPGAAGSSDAASGTWFAFALLVLAAAIGFLPFNAPRARIFLGDVGSGALGFVVACLLLHAIVAGLIAWPLAALLVSAFLIDAGWTLLLRIVRGRAWWRPHREHLYQWLVRSGYTHMQVACGYAGWTLLAATAALLLLHRDRTIGGPVSVVAVLFGSYLWARLRNRLWIAARHRC